MLDQFKLGIKVTEATKNSRWSQYNNQIVKEILFGWQEPW